MTLDPERLGALQAAKLAALVRQHPGAGAPGEPSSFPGGAALVAGGVAWVSVGEEAEAVRSLGLAMAWARRQGATALHLVVDDAESAGVLARRASTFAVPPSVWHVDGRALVAADPAPPPPAVAPPPEAELLTLMLAEAGAEVVVEHGVVAGEVLGLEVARVVAEPGGATHLEAGVGRFDREASAMLHGELTDADALARVLAIVRRHRRPGAEPHPLNRMAPERWLRALVLAEPGVVGASELVRVGPAVARTSLVDETPAIALGRRDGTGVVVACSSGVDLDAVPAAADARLAHAPDAALVVVVPERDLHPVTRSLAAALAPPAQVLGVRDDWKSVGRLS